MFLRRDFILWRDFSNFVGLAFLMPSLNRIFMAEEGNIIVRRAKVNNLKDVQVSQSETSESQIPWDLTFYTS